MTNDKGNDGILQLSIFAGAFVFGIVMSFLGSLLPSLINSMGLNKAEAGQLFLGMNFAMLVSSLLFGPTCDRFGFRAVLIGSTLLIGSAFALLSRAQSYGAIGGSLALLGFGGGALNGGTNALLSDISGATRQRALNLLGIFFGCGALLTPFMIGSLLEWIGLVGIFFCLMALALIPFVLYSVARFPEPKHQQDWRWPKLSSVLQNPLLYLFGILLLLQSGNEFTMGGWISTYLGEHHNYTPQNAAYVLAAYWATMMLGRLTVSLLGSKVAAPAIVMTSAAVAMSACAGLILAGRAVAPVFVSLIGLGFAAIFPTTLAQVGALFTEYSGTAFSVIFAMALTGGMTAPWLVGRIAQECGIGPAFWVTAASCCAIAALQLVIGAHRAGGRRALGPG
jgi:fucose permease